MIIEKILITGKNNPMKDPKIAEKLKGENHWMRKNPEKILKGDNHWMNTNPEAKQKFMTENAKQIKVNKAAEKKAEDWMTSKWRPLMAITYMATIWFDFIVGPVIFNVLQYYNPGQAVTSWTPLTLQGGGLYHLSMGAILGIAAFTRGKEKVAEIEAGKSQG